VEQAVDKGKLPDISKIISDITVKPSREAVELAGKYGYRPYMVERYIRMLGYSETIELLKAFQKKIMPIVRCNTLKIKCSILRDRLGKLGFRLQRIEWCPECYRLKGTSGAPSIGATHEYLKGYYYVHRDASSLLPPLLLIPRGYTGRALDACAAPGGKTTFMAQLMGNKGTIIANDLVLYRLKPLIGHLARLGVRNTIVTWGDARRLPSLLDEKFPRILVDAPCSGEGTIMLDPGRKTRTTIRDLTVIVRREMEILNATIDLLEEDGILAYSTCSIAPEENEYVVAKVMEARGDFEITPPKQRLLDWSPWLTRYNGLDFPPEYKGCVRIWPHRHGMVGFTVCLLRKKR
jgi:NOL1/NOP2/sun family putative RNA methylase